MDFNFIDKDNLADIEGLLESVYNSAILSIDEMLKLHLDTYGCPPTVTEDGFKSCVNLFIAGISSQLVVLQDEYNVDDNVKKEMTINCGKDILSLLKKYTTLKYDIDESALNRSSNCSPISKSGMEGKEIQD